MPGSKQIMAKGTRQTTEDITFVLLGTLGSGKSSTGNTILGDKRFKFAIGTKAVTTECQSFSCHRFNSKITVIDTPGLTNAASFPSIKEEIKSYDLSEQNRVVYAIIIMVGRYNNEEKLLHQELLKKHKLILKSCIIIFTNRNELLGEDDPVDQKVESWIKKNPSLQKLISDYGLKFVAFENKRLPEEENNNQVSDLMAMVSGNGQVEQNLPVSEKIKKGRQITVNRELLVDRFGQFGGTFFDQQYSLQNQ